MNRAERRKKALSAKPKVNNLKAIKLKAASQAADTAFFLMLAIPVMVIHDKYPRLMKRTVEGKTREERFADMCIDLYDSFNRGYVTLEDLSKCLWEEGGIKLERK